MEISFEQYELIQDYLDGAMTPERREDFETELGANPALAEHLVFERDLKKNLESIKQDRMMAAGTYKPASSDKFEDSSYILGLIHAAGQDFRTTVSDQTSRQSHTISINYKTGWAIAASVIIVVTCTIAFFKLSSDHKNIAYNIDTSGSKQRRLDSIRMSLPPSKPDFATLFKQFFTKEETPEERPVYLADALNDYDRGKYSSIQNQSFSNIPVYRDYINSKENVLEQGHFYKGMAFIETGNSREAIRNLQWVIGHAGNQQLVTRARWYLALVYLKGKDKDRAVSLLNGIAEDTQSTVYKGKAKKLVDLLRD